MLGVWAFKVGSSQRYRRRVFLSLIAMMLHAALLLVSITSPLITYAFHEKIKQPPIRIQSQYEISRQHLDFIREAHGRIKNNLEEMLGKSLDMAVAAEPLTIAIISTDLLNSAHFPTPRNSREVYGRYFRSTTTIYCEPECLRRREHLDHELLHHFFHMHRITDGESEAEEHQLMAAYAAHSYPAQAKLHRANQHLRERHEGKAIRLLHTAIEEDPNLCMCFRSLGIAQARKGNRKMTIKKTTRDMLNVQS